MSGFYEVVEIDNYINSLVIRERSFHSLKNNEILIKVFCTPINISDIMFIKGLYGNKKPEMFPIIPGLEGSGEIIDVGLNVDKDLIGKRVAVLADPDSKVSFDGLWAEYHYTTLDEKIIIFKNNIAYEKICFLIDPLTALGMLDLCKKEKLHSVVMTAAAGNLGRMFIKLCESEDIETICLVKNQDEESSLKEIGGRNIVRLNDPECFLHLSKLCFQLKTKIAFDCLGGNFTGLVLNSLQNNSTLYHLGSLEEKVVTNINNTDLTFKNKTIKGFWYNSWLTTLSKQEYDYWWGYLRSELQTQSSLFHSHIESSYDLDEIDFAIADYQMNMNKGKVVIAPYRILVKGN